MTKRLNIKQFFEIRANFAIHCDTEEKAKKLLKAFDKTGRRWPSGQRYTNCTAWGNHKEETCYGNTGGCDSVEFCREYGYIVFEFEEIELD